jgi:hypothetical protein
VSEAVQIYVDPEGRLCAHFRDGQSAVLASPLHLWSAEDFVRLLKQVQETASADSACVDADRSCNDDDRAEVAREQATADAAFAEAVRRVRELDRLRSLIRVVVARARPGVDQDSWPMPCSFCRAMDGASHSAECPWPALVAEAEKP